MFGPEDCEGLWRQFWCYENQQEDTSRRSTKIMEFKSWAPFQRRSNGFPEESSPAFWMEKREYQMRTFARRLKDNSFDEEIASNAARARRRSREHLF